MRIAKGAFIFLFVTVASSAAASFAQTGAEPRGQTPAAAQCPRVIVSCPDTPEPDGSLIFTVNVSGGDPNVTPTFKWAVSSGVISSGQGTSSITLSTAGESYSNWTAIVEVGGYDRSCQTADSCSLYICPPPQARKVDEYGAISLGDEKARLDNINTELQNDPTAQGYLICYGGRRSRAGEGKRRCYRAMDYLVQTRGIEASRVVTVDGGSREEPTVEFWLVPSGAEPPRATPTASARAGRRR